MQKHMAELLSYKRFNNVRYEASNDNLASTKMSNLEKLSTFISPAVHKKYTKRTSRTLCNLCLICFYACRKRKTRNSSEDGDIDKAVEEYVQKKGLSTLGSARSSLQSKKGAGCFWSWNESWKSNSDKFLESLELDGVGSDKSLKRKLQQSNSKVRITACGRFQGSECFIYWRLSMIF